MTEYQPGHLKQRLDTLQVAMRTAFPENDERLAEMAWIVIAPRGPAKHAVTAVVADWPDLYIPPVA